MRVQAPTTMPQPSRKAAYAVLGAAAKPSSDATATSSNSSGGGGSGSGGEGAGAAGATVLIAGDADDYAPELEALVGPLAGLPPSLALPGAFHSSGGSSSSSSSSSGGGGGVGGRGAGDDGAAPAAAAAAALRANALRLLNFLEVSFPPPPPPAHLPPHPSLTALPRRSPSLPGIDRTVRASPST